MTALDYAFWDERWKQQQIGFHEGAANDLLVAHVGELERGRGRLRVLVPLAGKAEDMTWLERRGHEVVGVEFVFDAVAAFFAARGVEVGRTTTKLGPLDAFADGGVTMLCKDFFELTPDAIGTFDAIYDRAALVALEPSTRARYVDTCRALCKPDARALIIAMAYDQSRTEGPPWSCDRAEILALWPNAVALQTRSVTTSPRLTAAGVPTLEETAYIVDPARPAPTARDAILRKLARGCDVDALPALAPHLLDAIEAALTADREKPSTRPSFLRCNGARALLRAARRAGALDLAHQLDDPRPWIPVNALVALLDLAFPPPWRAGDEIARSLVTSETLGPALARLATRCRDGTVKDAAFRLAQVERLQAWLDAR